MRCLLRTLRLLGGAALATVLLAGTAGAQTCGNEAGGFPGWLEQVKQDAAAQGISRSAVQAGLDGLTYDRATIQRDRGQKVFRQSFEQFSGRMVNEFRIRKGRQLIQKYQAVFDRIDGDFGVPAPVLVAIWGLETDFGAFVGNFQTIRSLATLAYDCRRSQKFYGELLDALRIVEHGDMMPSAMHGAWAGEIGQTQFMPSSYRKFGTDYDGNGRVDLVRSVPDVLGSTAKYLAGFGWQRGGPWEPGSANFAVIQQWNASAVYSKTIALLATRIAEGS